MKLICSWKVLFQYAGEVGKARMAYEENPTPENQEILNKAIDDHESYRQMCLEADEMIHFPYIGDII